VTGPGGGGLGAVAVYGGEVDGEGLGEGMGLG
jgi:hypothetical protein